jgi:hypothetical protein
MRQMAATIVATTIRYDALLPADSDTIEISAPDPEGNVVPHEVAVGGGSHSGRSMRLGGVVMAKAADQIVEKGARLAAWRLESAVADLEFSGGRFRVRGTDRAIGLFELAAAAGRPDAPEDLRGPLDGASDETVSTPSFPYGCAVCEVEVDPGDRRGRGRPLHLRGRRRPRHQPADRRRADPRRDRPGPGPGPLGALPLRRGERPAPVRDVHGVRAAARRSPALVHHRDQRGAVYREPARATWAAARAGRPRRSGPR